MMALLRAADILAFPCPLSTAPRKSLTHDPALRFRPALLHKSHYSHYSHFVLPMKPAWVANFCGAVLSPQSPLSPFLSEQNTELSAAWYKLPCNLNRSANNPQAKATNPQAKAADSQAKATNSQAKSARFRRFSRILKELRKRRPKNSLTIRPLSRGEKGTIHPNRTTPHGIRESAVCLTCQVQVGYTQRKIKGLPEYRLL